MRKTILVGLAAALIAAAANRPPVADAAKSGDKDALRALLQKRADVNATEADGTTALHWAAYRDDVESADMLIRAGAKVNAANDLGATPLWTASQNGSSAMVRRLLDAGANPNLALSAGETPLMVAARGGYPEVADLLLAKGANPNARGSRGQTALMWAVSQRHPEVVKVLLAKGADIHARSEVWNEVMAVPPHGLLEFNKAIPHGGETALMFAARVDDLASAKLLVAAGANVNDADAWGVSAVTLAAHSGFEDVMEYLLEKRADPNAAAAGFSALHIAILRRNEKMVSALLANGADVSAPLKTWTPTRRSSKDLHFDAALVGATPFWLAARYSEPAIMRLLVKHGADPLFIQHSEYATEQRMQHRSEVTTAVMAALAMGGGGAAWVPVPPREREALALEAIKVAVDLGVDINAANTDGRTALDAANTLRFSSVVKFLTEKGAKAGNPNAKPEAPTPVN
jgi:ankyrin repeat protein